VANGRFQAWWPMECSKLGGQWKVKEKHLFISYIFPPTTFTQTFNFFPLTLRFYFTMVLSRYSRLPFPFLRSINYNCAPQCNKSSTPSLLI
jgi:hypothetical protein